MNANHEPDNVSAASQRACNRRLIKYSALAVALSIAGMAAVAKTTLTLPDSSPLAIEPSAIQAPASFAALVETVKPAVVNVAVTSKSGSISSTNLPDWQLPDDPRFKEFFERFLPQTPSLPDRSGVTPGVRGVGSGFIVTPDGYIVTSNHVIENATELEVVLNDGRRLSAQIRGRDPKTDLALLKIDADSQLPYVSFGDSEAARPGDWVIAIGNPFGLGGTATTGIISARGRDIQAGPYDDYLQIDAPINRGNSGGPLFDLSGRVIGVNTAIFSPNGGNVGIGFAVPAVQAKSVIEQLMNRGYVERGWLGVQIQTVTESLAESMKLPDTRGALVAQVTPGSPAARAGIQVGDVILNFNEKEITNMKALPHLVAAVAPGQKTQVTVWRQGKERVLDVSLARSPELTADATDSIPGAGEGAKLGLALAPMTEELRQRFDVARDIDGVMVVQVEAGSPAARQGLRPGDVIVQANGKPVSEPTELAKLLRESQSRDQEQLLLLVNRQGNQHFMTVRLV